MGFGAVDSILDMEDELDITGKRPAVQLQLLPQRDGHTLPGDDTIEERPALRLPMQRDTAVLLQGELDTPEECPAVRLELMQQGGVAALLEDELDITEKRPALRLPMQRSAGGLLEDELDTPEERPAVQLQPLQVRDAHTLLEGELDTPEERPAVQLQPLQVRDAHMLLEDDLETTEQRPALWLQRLRLQGNWFQGMRAQPQGNWLQRTRLQPAGAQVPERPALAPDVQLVGELQGSGFKDRQWLIQRDGQFIQLTELLYRVVQQINGERTLEEIAAAVTDATDWLVTADHIRQIVKTKLLPMELLAGPGGSSPARERPQMRSPLSINMRMKVIGPRFIDPFTRVLQVLYAPPVLIPMLVLIVIAHGWLYFIHGITDSIYSVIYTPGQLLLVTAVVLVSAVFHEFGHASALRYGGGKVRGMGAGIYIIYPVFYTDTTDSYRLSRWARIRTDLGGFYFHLIFALGVIAFYLISKQESLLAIVILIDLDLLSECSPLVRFDGYWVLADLTGIPDLFSQMIPFIRGMLPIPSLRNSGSKLPDVKRWVRSVFVGYTIIAVLGLGISLFLLLWYEPTIDATAWDAVVVQRAAFVQYLNSRDPLGVTLSTVQELLLTVPLLGGGYMFYSLGWRLIKAVWNWSKLSLRRCMVSVLSFAAVIALLAILWAPQMPFLTGSVLGFKPIDGIRCDQGEQFDEHIHAHLAIYVKGRAVTVPQYIGIPAGGACFYWLHTHLTDGVIHVEAPAQGVYTLGQFTDVWAQTMQTSVLTSTSLLGQPLQGHQLVIWTSLNGQSAQRYTGDLRALVLQNHEIITVAYDSPQIKPATYFDWVHSSAGG